jgi:hypothetical protein
MTTLPCRYLVKNCLDTLCATDAMEIQKVFLHHVHLKHPIEWRQFSQQFKVISVVSIRNRFLKQVAEDLSALALATTNSLKSPVS